MRCSLLVVWLMWSVGAACSFEWRTRPRPPAAPLRSAHVDLAIATRVLPSGLRVVTVRDPRASEVQVTMRYAVGAAADGADAGIAHLVEHLMFEQVLDGVPVFAHLEDSATFFNAKTTFDATTYIARGPVASLDTLLAIEAVRLEQRCEGVSDAAFARERQVVLNELVQRDQASVVYGAIHAAIYVDGHPYRRPLGGSAESIGAITRERACAFADRWYAPANAVLVVSGPVGEAQLADALAKLSARITRRAGATPVAVPAIAPRPLYVELGAPIDDDVLVLAWPLPAEPRLQARARAVGAALPRLVDAEIKGSVIALELGDAGAPMFAIAVVRDDGETLAEVFEGTRRGIASLARVLGESDPDDLDGVVFDRIKYGAIYELYAGVEDGSGRDEQLARAVLAGRDAATAVADDIASVRAMGREGAAHLAQTWLAADRPSVVALRTVDGKKRGDKVTLRVPVHDVHDLGQRRSAIDPALASRRVERAPSVAHASTTRVLPNGLRVVLLPTTAAPTVEARLVFGAGTADEPGALTGVAMLAAHTLTWDLHHLNDAVAFVRAGGMRDTDVGIDRTTFSVQGLDANLDVMLAGLRRWVRDGVYDASARSFVQGMHRAAKRGDDEGLLTDSWRASLFGAHHPYVRAGLARHANTALTLDDARGFRRAYYTPDNATLVIAGRFDPALAERWIEFLFADWHGRAAGRSGTQAMPQPGAIAMRDDTTLVQLRFAAPARTGTRAQRLVAAAMLDEIARDVRHQLGASYSFDAYLAETRLASFYFMGGFVAAPRTKAAVQLVDSRLRELRDDANARARAFVVARRRVLTQLQSRTTSASALAARVQRDVELGRPPLSELAVADEVAALTIEPMGAVLAELDLGRGTVLMDGPREDIDPAFAALGLQPRYVEAANAATATSAPGTTPPAFDAWEQHVLRGDLEPALTLQPPPRLAWIVSAAATAAFVDAHPNASFTGYSYVAALGYRYRWANAIGLHLGVARLDADLNREGPPMHVGLMPINVLAMWHLGTARRAWGDVLFGLHLERIGDDWRAAPMWALQGGYDLVRGLGIALRIESSTRSELDYLALSFGLALRR